MVEMLVVPERTRLQRSEALLLANQIRTARAQLKRLVAGDPGLVLVERIVADPFAADEMVGDAPAGFVLSMLVTDLLLAAPKMGTVKVGSALRRLKISSRKTMGGLSQRQRVELAGWCAEWATTRGHRR